MATAFNMLRANDLIWSFVVNNYLLGKEQVPFDLLFWNSDSTRMPAAMHSFYLRKMYQENLLATPGGISLAGTPIDLSKIRTPTFILSTREDHIAPWKSTYAATRLYSGPVKFVLSASGHIAGVISAPGSVRKRDGSTFTVRARSMVGLLPIFAAVQFDASLWERHPMFSKRARWYIENKPGVADFLHILPTTERPSLISLVGKSRLRRLLSCMLDEAEFLSPYGLRSLSRYHREHPLIVDLDGQGARLDYEPGESRTGLFGGNSNWRGPIWFPLNFLAIESLRHLHASFGEDFTVELPTGSGKQASLEQVSEELERRLLKLFMRDPDGRRPTLGSNPLFQHDGAWRDSLLFHEYFHGDTGEGLGASHQTGWTALVGALVANRRLRGETGCVIGEHG